MKKWKENGYERYKGKITNNNDDDDDGEDTYYVIKILLWPDSTISFFSLEYYLHLYEYILSGW